MASEIRLYRSLDEARGRVSPSGLSIGNFDGVHRGHQELFQMLVRRCRSAGWNPVVLTFDPHPASVVAPDRAPRLLSSIEQRVRWMRDCGIEHVVVLPFTLEFSRLTPQEFVRQVVVEAAGAQLVVVGGNFRFGAGQAGNASVLAGLGKDFSFTTEVAAEVICRGRLVSSSAIRRLIEEGDIRTANRLLRRPYTLEGRVIPGHGVGKGQTVPTLNLASPSEVVPGRGVYVTRVHGGINGDAWPAVTNVGYRPTFGEDDKLSIESYILEEFRELAPVQIAVEFLFRLRDEKKFPSPEALKEQILRDVSRARRYFRLLRRRMLL
jgi:riboflavin kinase/FMN adenylyltransferase